MEWATIDVGVSDVSRPAGSDQIKTIQTRPDQYVPIGFPELVQIGNPIRMQFVQSVLNTYQSIHDVLVCICMYWSVLVSMGLLLAGY